MHIVCVRLYYMIKTALCIVFTAVAAVVLIAFIGLLIVLICSINRDWSFDESIANYGCEVHSFDPRFD